MDTVQAVIANTKLDPMEKLVLVALAANADGEGRVTMDHKVLSRVTGLNMGACGRIEKRLIAEGWLDGRIYRGAQVSVPSASDPDPD